MKTILDIHRAMEYPGRFLIMQHSGDVVRVVYGVTARNPASKAKRYAYHESLDTVSVVPTDIAVMAQGDLSLLDYTAVHIHDTGIVVGNGRQTDMIGKFTEGSASEQLIQNLKDVVYEHDKYATPRITACVLEYDGELTAALHQIRKGVDEEVVRVCYEIFSDGYAYFLSTYAGPNVRPTPSFTEEPIAFARLTGDVQDMVETIYDAFAPSEGMDDLRVSVVGCEYLLGGEKRVYTHNRL